MPVFVIVTVWLSICSGIRKIKAVRIVYIIRNSRFRIKEIKSVIYQSGLLTIGFITYGSVLHICKNIPLFRNFIIGFSVEIHIGLNRRIKIIQMRIVT